MKGLFQKVQLLSKDNNEDKKIHTSQRGKNIERFLQLLQVLYYY